MCRGGEGERRRLAVARAGQMRARVAHRLSAGGVGDPQMPQAATHCVTHTRPAVVGLAWRTECVWMGGGTLAFGWGVERLLLSTLYPSTCLNASAASSFPYVQVLGAGELPNTPVVVKAKFFSKDAEKKIKAVGGACVLVA